MSVKAKGACAAQQCNQLPVDSIGNKIHTLHYSYVRNIPKQSLPVCNWLFQSLARLLDELAQSLSANERSEASDLVDCERT